MASEQDLAGLQIVTHLGDAGVRERRAEDAMHVRRRDLRRRPEVPVAEGEVGALAGGRGEGEPEQRGAVRIFRRAHGQEREELPLLRLLHQGLEVLGGGERARAARDLLGRRELTEQAGEIELDEEAAKILLVARPRSGGVPDPRRRLRRA